MQMEYIKSLSGKGIQAFVHKSRSTGPAKASLLQHITHSAAVLMHFVDQHGNIFRWRELRNSVA